jgi:hypothetical protein
MAEIYWHAPSRALFIAAALIAAGSFITCATRTRAIVMQLRGAR